MLHYYAFTRQNSILVPRNSTATAVNLFYCNWPCYLASNPFTRENSRLHPVPWTPCLPLIAFLDVETYTSQRPVRCCEKQKNTYKKQLRHKTWGRLFTCFCPQCSRLRCGHLFTAVMSRQNIGCMLDREIIFVTLIRKPCASWIIMAKMMNNQLSVVGIKPDFVAIWGET